MVEHVDITDPEIHEPKGVASASQGQVYQADGAGSGDWVNNRPEGWGRYHDPNVQNLTTTAAVLTNDGTGADTEEGYLPLEIRGVSSLWDIVADEITPINTADVLLIKLDFDVTAVVTAAYLILEVDDGGATSPSSVLTTIEIPISGTPTFNRSVTFLQVVSANMIANGGQLFLKTDAGTASIDELKITIHRLSDGTN